MPHNRRLSQLALKLDVIVEEDLVEVIDNIHPDTSHTTTTYTVTLQNAQPHNGNDPMFLHTGKWPSVDMLKHPTQPTACSANTYTNGRANMVACKAQDTKSKEKLSEKIDGDQWQPVAAGQLSMAMDFWDPEDKVYPFITSEMYSSRSCLMTDSIQNRTVTAVQHSLFCREVLEEYSTRAQTVEHLEELEDNDNAIEVVATLEGYRQNGWSEEMLQAFPRECWLFWCASGLGHATHASQARISDECYPVADISCLQVC